MLVTLIVISILIFPFFSSVYLSAKWQEKTACITISIFGISLYKINTKLVGTQVTVKKTFRKPYRTGLLPSLNFRGKMPKIKNINVLSVETILNIGINADAFASLALIFSLNVANIPVCAALNAYKPFLKLKNNINIYEDVNVLDAYLRLKTVFNLIDVIMIIVGILSEKIYNAIGKQNK